MFLQLFYFKSRMSDHSNNHSASPTNGLFEEYFSKTFSDYYLNNSTFLNTESCSDKKLKGEAKITKSQENISRPKILIAKRKNIQKNVIICYIKERIKILKENLKIYYKKIKDNYIKMERKKVYKNKCILSVGEKSFIKNITYKYLYIVILIIKKKLFLLNSLIIIF